MNHSAFQGSSMAMSRAPTAQPMKAPTMGIRAVRAMRTPTSNA